MKVVAVAVVGKGNNPLYLKAFNKSGGVAQEEGEETLKLTYIVHTSLDVVEEKIAAPGRRVGGAPSVGGESFLGLLFPTEEYRVYGYITSTKLKLVVIVDDVEPVRETEMRGLFKAFHHLVVNQLCNPFYVTDSKIVSAPFDERIRRMAATGGK